MEDQIIALRKKYHLQSTFELKGKNLLGTKFEPLLEEALNVAFENECYIFLTSLEKKFMIAGKAVEDLFDPLYNNKTTDKWTHPIQIKKDIADHFFNHLSAETMRIMGEAFQIGEYSKILIS